MEYGPFIYTSKINLMLWIRFRKGLVQACNQRGKGREVFPALFPKLGKSALVLGKKCPDCGHLWVKFFISSAVFKSFQEKNRRFFPAGPFFVVLWMIVYRSAIIPRKLPFSKKFLLTRQLLCFVYFKSTYVCS